MDVASRFTVSVPPALLTAIDQKLTRPGESRGDVVRRLIEAALRAAMECDEREATERDEIERYLRSYREQPQTEEEFGWPDVVTKEASSQLR